MSERDESHASDSDDDDEEEDGKEGELPQIPLNFAGPKEVKVDNSQDVTIGPTINMTFNVKNVVVKNEEKNQMIQGLPSGLAGNNLRDAIGEMVMHAVVQTVPKFLKKTSLEAIEPQNSLSSNHNQVLCNPSTSYEIEEISTNQEVIPFESNDFLKEESKTESPQNLPTKLNKDMNNLSITKTLTECFQERNYCQQSETSTKNKSTSLFDSNCPQLSSSEFIEQKVELGLVQQEATILKQNETIGGVENNVWYMGESNQKAKNVEKQDQNDTIEQRQTLREFNWPKTKRKPQETTRNEYQATTSYIYDPKSAVIHLHGKEFLLDVFLLSMLSYIRAENMTVIEIPRIDVSLIDKMKRYKLNCTFGELGDLNTLTYYNREAFKYKKRSNCITLSFIYCINELAVLYNHFSLQNDLLSNCSFGGLAAATKNRIQTEITFVRKSDEIHSFITLNSINFESTEVNINFVFENDDDDFEVDARIIESYFKTEYLIELKEILRRILTKSIEDITGDDSILRDIIENDFIQ